MPKIKYMDCRFHRQSVEIIDKANELITTYRQQGYSLTLRQLYYQFVARDLLPAKWADPKTGSTNNQKSYQKLGNILSDARLAGLIDWEAIEDRTRNVDGNSHWENPSKIIASAAASYQLDKWKGQEYRVEVWVEKDALEGIVSKACRELDIQYLSCRGYTSQTAMWDSGMRLQRYAARGEKPVILHLGDLDPSGVDMSRDIQERLRLFMEEFGDDLIFERMALNVPQIKQYNPPPNPAKKTDCRFEKFCQQYGDQSWELDALDPAVIDNLIHEYVAKYRDDTVYRVREELEAEQKETLAKAAKHWQSDIAPFVAELE